MDRTVWYLVASTETHECFTAHLIVQQKPTDEDVWAYLSSVQKTKGYEGQFDYFDLHPPESHSNYVDFEQVKETLNG